MPVHIPPPISTSVCPIRSRSHGVASFRPGQAVDRGGLAADVLAQAVGVDHHDEAQRDRHAEGRMADALAQRDQGRHAGHGGAVVAREAAVADQVEGPARWRALLIRNLIGPTTSQVSNGVTGK
jgi:hypothetical protein